MATEWHCWIVYKNAINSGSWLEIFLLFWKQLQHWRLKFLPRSTEGVKLGGKGCLGCNWTNVNIVLQVYLFFLFSETGSLSQAGLKLTVSPAPDTWILVLIGMGYHAWLKYTFARKHDICNRQRSFGDTIGLWRFWEVKLKVSNFSFTFYF